MMTYGLGVAMIVGGYLLIAETQVGAFLTAFTLAAKMLSVDNPLLSPNSTAHSLAVSNMLKDLGLIAAALILAFKTRKIIHRHPQTQRRN